MKRPVWDIISIFWPDRRKCNYSRQNNHPLLALTCRQVNIIKQQYVELWFSAETTERLPCSHISLLACNLLATRYLNLNESKKLNCFDTVSPCTLVRAMKIFKWVFKHIHSTWNDQHDKWTFYVYRGETASHKSNYTERSSAVEWNEISETMTETQLLVD